MLVTCVKLQYVCVIVIVCIQRKSETEQRIIIKQNKDVELERRVQRLESEKQASDVCIV